MTRAIDEDVLWALDEVSEMDEDTQEMLAVAACNLSLDTRGRTKLLAGPVRTLMEMIADENCSTNPIVSFVRTHTYTHSRTVQYSPLRGHETTYSSRREPRGA